MFIKYHFCDWRVGWPTPAGRKALVRLGRPWPDDGLTAARGKRPSGTSIKARL
ncbi:MAG TPA: hypothetical protein VK105_16465 [Virgibacillus sp.]|nr:hypothetical protein [Virgibacillus sp.]HLR68692.1 hypothetical protein [Virgibacillus sp.]